MYKIFRHNYDYQNHWGLLASGIRNISGETVEYARVAMASFDGNVDEGTGTYITERSDGNKGLIELGKRMVTDAGCLWEHVEDNLKEYSNKDYIVNMLWEAVDLAVQDKDITLIKQLTDIIEEL